MISNSREDQMSSAGELTSKNSKGDIPSKKTAFDWKLFDNRSETLKDLRRKQEFVDLMLMTEDGGQEITHFAVISTLGKQFTEYIYNQINEPNNKEVVLENGSVVKTALIKSVNKSVLKMICDLSYNGFLQTNSVEVWSLIESAELYSLSDVLKSSLTYLIYELNIENCIQIFHLGLKHKHKLSNSSYTFIRTNFSEIVENCVHFSDLSYEELSDFIVDDELNINSEDIVFSAIIRWITEDINTRKDKLFNLISKIRFARFQISFLANEIMNNKLIKENKLCTDLIAEYIKNYKTLSKKKDGNRLYVALSPIQVRPRIPHDVLLAFGGWQEGIPSTMMESYDIRTNLWFDTKLSNERPRAYHGMEVIDGMIYVIGGTNGTQILDTVQCFNPISKKWYERHSMTERRCYVSTVTIDGIIYALGGHNGRNRLKSCEKYNKNDDKWTDIAEMNMIRSDGSAAVYQNKIYIAGGLNDQLIENTVEVYNPLDNSWTFIQSMSVPRTSLGLVSDGKHLYAIGGNNGIERLESVERYDFNFKTWVLMNPMTSKRSTFATTLIGDQIFVIGGQTPICSVESYDTNENNWTEVRGMKHDRSGLAVCLLRGLSNSSDYTFIGINSRKCKQKNKIIDSTKKDYPSEEGMDFD